MTKYKKILLSAVTVIGLVVIVSAVLAKHFFLTEKIITQYACTTDADCTVVSHPPTDMQPCCPSCTEFIVNTEAAKLFEQHRKVCFKEVYGCPMALCTPYPPKVETHCRDSVCVGTRVEPLRRYLYLKDLWSSPY